MSLAIETFAENVRQFCQWVESNKHDIQTARQLLLALMQGIPYLSVSEPEDESEREYPRRDYGQWTLDHKHLADFPLQYYREVFAPCDLLNEEPAGTGDAYDDLADIYGELWHGLQALDRGDDIYAVIHWRDSYFQHWGHHASAVIYAVDEYYRSTLGDCPDIASSK
jgi:hypothetical protein